MLAVGCSLLKQGGNSKTALLVTCSPHTTCFSETLSTLRFAKRAKAVKVHPVINREYTVSELMEIVAQLRKLLAEKELTIKELEAKLRRLVLFCGKESWHMKEII